MTDKFKTLTSTCIPLPMENVDTDQIIPARFLKATTREGFGDNLFRDWRYDKEGNPIPGFVLNDPTYSGTVLVAGKNSEADRVENMPHGLLPDMDSKLSFQVFLPIFLKTMH